MATESVTRPQLFSSQKEGLFNHTLNDQLKTWKPPCYHWAVLRRTTTSRNPMFLFWGPTPSLDVMIGFGGGGGHVAAFIH